MFEPGVLPEAFPKARERMPRKLLAQEAQPQETQTGSESVANNEAAMADEVAIKTEVIEGEREGQLVFAKVEQETIEAMLEPVAASGEAEAQFEANKTVIRPTYKGKGKKNVAATENEGK